MPINPDSIFETSKALSTELCKYDPEGTSLWDLAHLLRSAADVTNLSVSFYEGLEPQNAVYREWFTAMRWNMGNPDPLVPFDGIMLEANDLFLKQLKDSVQEYIKDPDPTHEKDLDVVKLLQAPIKVYQAINACEWVSLNMELNGEVPDDLIPDRCPMEQASTLEALYGCIYSDMEDILRKLPIKQYDWVKDTFIDCGKKEVPHVLYEWYLSEKSASEATENNEASEASENSTTEDSAD